MKKLPVLRDWTKVLLLLCIIPIVVLPGLILTALLFPDLVPIDYSILGTKGLTTAKIIVVLIAMGGYSLFVYALYLFGKVLKLFSQRKIFDDDVVKYFSQMGKFIYYGLLLIAIPTNLYIIFTTKGLTLDTEKLFDIVFTGTLGFFFTVLSEVFQKAKNIKEENDLTV